MKCSFCSSEKPRRGIWRSIPLKRSGVVVNWCGSCSRPTEPKREPKPWIAPRAISR